ncbi:MAG: FkbM family methyltransferase [Bernardetiaceae bacterium]|jgi:FkbM family methyltransferase|nr:FkbM family methyltransferase [Bernardetiaceae bacterium]
MSKINNLITRITNRLNRPKKGVALNHVWYGNTYGGFFVYPDGLNENSVVYSFGIGEDISFDQAVMENHHCPVFGFDPTPKSVNWVSQQPVLDQFHFYPFGIAAQSGLVDFYLPRNPDHVSGSMVGHENLDTLNRVEVEMKSLTDIMHELGHRHLDLLKMDIEGAEYWVMENILNANIPITQILIEFHDRFYENEPPKSTQVIRQLKRKGYEIFAISESWEELSFIHRDALKSY